MVYIILGKGFEPVEAIAPCDILRRGGVDVKLAGIGGKTVEAAHGVTVAADCTVEEIDQNALEMIVLPGGLGGVESILGLPGGAGRGEARVGRRQICSGHLRGADGAGQARHHGGPQGDLLSRLRDADAGDGVYARAGAAGREAHHRAGTRRVVRVRAEAAGGAARRADSGRCRGRNGHPRITRQTEGQYGRTGKKRTFGRTI